MLDAFENTLNRHKRVTLLAHQNTSTDSLATALALYAMLKNVGKQVEVCCVDELLPKNLDFLPHFAKIKRQIDFEESLIIGCAGATLASFGFEIGSREIVNIDVHKNNTHFGQLNLVDAGFDSTSHLAYEMFKERFSINKPIATCLYVGMLKETKSFQTAKVNQSTFLVVAALLGHKVDVAEVHQKLYQRNALRSLRLLSGALQTLTLHHQGKVASLEVSQTLFETSGAKVTDLEGVIDHALDLVTVKIALMFVVYHDKIEVVLQSKEPELETLVRVFGGNACGLRGAFTSKKMNIETLLNKILTEIKRKELVDG